MPKASQINVLCTFFEENPEVIRGYKKTSNGISSVQSKWRQITPHLNSLGAAKDYRSWAKYLCNVKAKLKRKKIKWRQNSDGTGPIICNADDFNEIELRMLQVLCRNADQGDSCKELNNSDCETEDNSLDIDNGKGIETVDVWNDDSSDKTQKVVHIKLVDDDSPLYKENVSQINKNYQGDEFDTFGNNVAHQLRALPLAVALETQEMLLSVLRKQRLKHSKTVINPH